MSNTGNTTTAGESCFQSTNRANFSLFSSQKINEQENKNSIWQHQHVLSSRATQYKSYPSETHSKVHCISVGKMKPQGKADPLKWICATGETQQTGSPSCLLEPHRQILINDTFVIVPGL